MSRTRVPPSPRSIALRTAAPDAVRYEEEAVVAARDQCQYLNHWSSPPSPVS